MDKENKLILYKDDEGKVSVNVRFADEDVWLTNNLIAEIYATTRQDIDYHIANIYSDGELNREATCKNYLQVRKEGNREVQRSLPHYNLDVIIAIGYRVQSPVAVRFRRWATQLLSTGDRHLCHFHRLRPSRTTDKAFLCHCAEQDALCRA